MTAGGRWQRFGVVSAADTSIGKRSAGQRRGARCPIQNSSGQSASGHAPGRYRRAATVAAAGVRPGVRLLPGRTVPRIVPSSSGGSGGSLRIPAAPPVRAQSSGQGTQEARRDFLHHLHPMRFHQRKRHSDRQRPSRAGELRGESGHSGNHRGKGKEGGQRLRGPFTGLPKRGHPSGEQLHARLRQLLCPGHQPSLRVAGGSLAAAGPIR